MPINSVRPRSLHLCVVLVLSLPLLFSLLLAGCAGQHSPSKGAGPPVNIPTTLLRLDGEGNNLAWGTTGEWQLENESYEGNPFDLIANVTFEHLASGETLTTQMFHVGEGRWHFRFAGSRLGEWRLETSSDDAELDGHSGSLTVIESNPATNGFLMAAGNKMVVSTDNGRTKEGVVYNVFVTQAAGLAHVGVLPTEPEALVARVNELLDQVESNGMNSLYVPVSNNWFSFGNRSYRDHDSENPDLTTFRVLEALITQAHARGMFVHFWAWGDETRAWTPVGVGGVNGEADLRLQRYISARLAPLPGWTMSYGFDLEEWASPNEVRAWAKNLHQHSAWPHLLMAREFGEDDGSAFTLGNERLDVFSTDDRPAADFYEVAASRLAEGLPVLFERRFLYLRNGIWDANTTRRALWQFALAGGAGSVWGVPFDENTPYPNQPELRIHREFWQGRLDPEMQPVAAVEGGYSLTTPERDEWILYQEDTDIVRFDLSGAEGQGVGVAVDTRAHGYQEIELGALDAGEQLWEAPYESDWAIAVHRPTLLDP